MSSVSLPRILTPGQPNNVNHVQENDVALRDKINGNIDADNLATAVRANLAQAGLTYDSSVRRGKSIIAASESRTNVAYGLLTTPDQVSGIVMPTDGLIAVLYNALWENSVANAAQAAIFLGANQLKVQGNIGAPVVEDIQSGSGAANLFEKLTTQAKGLHSLAVGGDLTSDVTTGMAVGTDTNRSSVCYIYAAAGTYDVSVQFRATSGSVTVKERKLWAWTMGF